MSNNITTVSSHKEDVCLSPEGNVNVSLVLDTDLGSFTFKAHHNSSAEFYEAAMNFESNNWEQLGEVTYRLTQIIGGEAIMTTYEGMNASAYLAANFSKEANDELSSNLSMNID